MADIKKQYKSGQIFWGILFLTIGVLFLLAKNNYTIDLPNDIWNYWPIIIILWGLSILTKGTIIKPLISALTGFLVAILLFSFFFGTEINQYNDDTEIEGSESVYNYFEDFNPNTQSAKLVLRAGAGQISIDGQTEKLIQVNTKGFENTLSFNTRYRDNEARIVLRNATEGFNILGDSHNRELNMQLNPIPIWDFDLKLGAAKIDLDLSQFSVSHFRLSTGATSSLIKFGEKEQNLIIDIEMGAASLDLKIPKDSGCLIKGDMVLVAKELIGFSKIASKKYVTENFENANNKIIINFDGGVSTLKIDRY